MRQFDNVTIRQWKIGMVEYWKNGRMEEHNSCGFVIRGIGYPIFKCKFIKNHNQGEHVPGLQIRMGLGVKPDRCYRNLYSIRKP